jgi:hypothetical protein
VNDELARRGRKRPWPNFKVISQHLLGGTEKSHKILSQDSLSPDRDFNPGPPEYIAGVLTTRQQRSLTYASKR